MRLYRVTWVDPAWSELDPSEAFHPLFVPVGMQGTGRFDNPHRYASLYASVSAVAAVGEVFGSYAIWDEEEVTRELDGRPRCLVQFEVPDELTILDLDDPGVLTLLALRPSDVVRRNRDRTQEVALLQWLGREQSGVRGVRWWSYWRPEWTVVALWSDSLEPPWFPWATVTDVEPLTMGHPAVVTAADVLPRQLG